MKNLNLLILAICISCIFQNAFSQDVQQTQIQEKPTIKKVILVFKTHVDIGFTDFASLVVKKYQTSIIDSALIVADLNRHKPKNEQFVWTLPGWPLYQIAKDWPGQTKERKDKVMTALHEGQFVSHALPFTTQTEILEPEDMVRGLIFSSKMSRDIGLPLPRAAKITDTPGQSWILPTLLKNAGVNFLHIGCNSGAQSPKVPRLFWWEGPDGSRLLTMYTPEGYHSMSVLPFSDWKYDIWLAMKMTGDNDGPPKPKEVIGYIKQIHEKYPDAEIKIGQLSDFADAILAENPELPVVRGDMPDVWIDGVSSNPDGMKIARDIRPLIGTTETLYTLLKINGISAKDETDLIASAYEKSLLHGEHTWGWAGFKVIAWYDERNEKMVYGETWKQQRKDGRFTQMEESWAEHAKYIETARDSILPALDQQLSVLANSVEVNGERIVVYNSLPWKRDGLVSIKLTGEMPQLLIPVDGGSAVTPVRKGDVMEFMAKDIPSMGYKTFVRGKGNKQKTQINIDENAGKFSNPFYEITLDPKRGTIKSLVDKKNGKEWVKASGDQMLGQYLYERFDSNQVAAYVKAQVKTDEKFGIYELGKPDLPSAKENPYLAWSPENFNIRYETTPTSVCAVLESKVKNDYKIKVTTKITLYQDLPYIDFEMTLHNKPADAWPEAGWFCLHFNIEKPQFHLGRLGSVIDPAKDIVPGSNHYVMAINTGIAITNQAGQGVGMVALDNPLASLDHPGFFEYSNGYTPEKANVYYNLFNNRWTTNYSLWNEGTWTSRFRLWTLDGDNANSEMITPSLEARYPLIGTMATYTKGRLPVSQAGLELSQKNVLVTAFGKNIDGEGTILRLWEMAGKNGICKVKLPEGLHADMAYPVNLRGEPVGKPIQVANNSFEVQVKAFAPVSFKFQNP